MAATKVAEKTMEEAATQLRLRLRPEPRKSKNFQLLVETHEIVYSSGDVDSDADSVFEGFERGERDESDTA